MFSQDQRRPRIQSPSPGILRRRTSLLILVGCCWFLTACRAHKTYGADKSSAPNIVLIVADDLGYGGIGCYGHRSIKTPQLDALASAGMRFTDFHSNGAVCSPTRAALMTGRYQQRSGIEGVVTAANHRHTGLPLAETTMAEMLQTAGYTAGICGKWHLGYETKFNPTKQGFDFFRGFVSGNVDYHSHIDQANHLDWWRGTEIENETGYTTDLITQHAVAFIEQNQQRPFFLYIAHEAPHYPLQGRSSAPQRMAGKPIKNVRGDDKQDVVAIHKEMVEVMDEGIGEVVATLKRLGLQRETLIFFMSDNGPMPQSSAGPLRGKKGSIYEGGHRVPALASWPGTIAAGQECQQATMGADLFPTFAALAGAKLAQGVTLDGRDLKPLLVSEAKLPPRDLFWRVGSGAAIRRGDWKLVATKAKQGTATALYNLKDDLAEEHDLADEQPQRAKELAKALAEWEESVVRGVERRS